MICGKPGCTEDAIYEYPMMISDEFRFRCKDHRHNNPYLDSIDIERKKEPSFKPTRNRRPLP